MAIMYDIKKVFCPNCGLRFTKDEYPGHLDDHYNENFNKKKGKIRQTSGRFLNEDQWITGTFVGLDNIHAKKNKKKKKEYVVTYTGEDKTCTICGEEFDVIWKSDINDWVLDNALIVKVVEKDYPKQKINEDIDKKMILEEDKKNDEKKILPNSKKIKEKKPEDDFKVLKKICMHPECYHVLAVQDDTNKPNFNN